MKSTIVRGFMLFAAGAGCASVVAGIYGIPPITVEDYLSRNDKLLLDIQELGQYPVFHEDGKVGINIAPETCGPKPPAPKMPAGAVDPRLLRHGIKALMAINEGHWLGNAVPVYADDKCKPYN